MSRYEGANADAGLVVEVTYGTAVSPRTGWICYATFSLVQTPMKIQPRTLKQDSRFSKTNPVYIRSECSLTVEGEMQFDFIGPLLLAAIGSVSTTGGGPYDHDFVPAYPLQSYTWELDTGDGSNSRVANGCTCNALTITIKPGELVSFKSDWMVRGVVAPASQGSPTYSATRPVIRAEDLAATWNGLTLTTEMRGATIEFLNNQERDYPVGSEFPAIPFTRGMRVAQVKLDIQYGSVIADAFQTGSLAATQSNLVLTITSGANVFLFTLYAAFVEGDAIPKVTSTDPLPYSVTLIGVASTSDPAVNLVVTNASSSAVANA